MTTKANLLHAVGARLHLLFVDQILGRRRASKISRQRQAVIITDDRRIGRLRMRMGIYQTVYTPGQAIVHAVRPWGHDFLIGIYQQADVTGRTRGGAEIFTDGPGNGAKIPIPVAG